MIKGEAVERTISCFSCFVGKRISFNDRAFVSIHKTKIIQIIIIIINQLNQSPYQKIFLALLHVIFFLFSSFFLWFLFFCFIYTNRYLKNTSIHNFNYFFPSLLFGTHSSLHLLIYVIKVCIAPPDNLEIQQEAVTE